jgi:hypothetical protein
LRGKKEKVRRKGERKEKEEKEGGERGQARIALK